MDQPNGDQETGDSATPNQQIVPPAIVSGTHDKKTAENPDSKKSTPAQKVKRPKNTCWRKTKRYLLRLCREGPDRHIELFLALVIVIFAAAQWHTISSNNDSTAQQMNQLISAAKYNAYAANLNALAAQSFADSARKINGGIDDAVRKLQTQADNTELARESSDTSAHDALKSAIDNFHQEQRAWVGIQSIVCVHCPKQGGGNEPVDINESRILIINTGRTPALHVKAEIIPERRTLRDPIPEFATVRKTYVPLEMKAPPEDQSIAQALYDLGKSETTLSPNLPFQVPLDAVPVWGTGPSDIGLNRPIWYILGDISYSDVYSPVVHHTTFCVLINNQFPVTEPVEFHFCQTGNSAD
jgi:hypothetical protein